jgi:flagellar biosynthesis/type III secretory pathway protein FliH
MSTIHISFPKALTSITAADCVVAVRDAVADEAHADQASESANQQALKTLGKIAQCLADLEAADTQLAKQVGERIHQAATQIAQTLLNDATLFQDRSLKFVQIALEQIDSPGAKVAYVHPSCLTTIENWIVQANIPSLSVAQDASVLPGDCRIDCGDTGVAATLDAFFECLSQQTHTTS